MVAGLGETSAERVNELLQMGGYAALTNAETAELGLTESPEIGYRVLLTNEPSEKWESDDVLSDRQLLINFGLPTLLLAIATTAFNHFGLAPTWLVVITSGLYASLYAISILLETAYAVQKTRVYWAAMLLFCLMFLSSTIALALDAWAVQSGSTESLWWTLLIFFGSAGVQWFWVRSILPAASIVPAKFQTLTAQTAHLKNTSYFLLFVVFFWVVPFHSVVSLNQLIRKGDSQAVRQIITSAEPFVGTSFVFAKPLWLWILALILIGFSVPMGAHLVDSLKAGRGHNRFLALFYGRALIYFMLCFLCLLWYSVSVSQLNAILPAAR